MTDPIVARRAITHEGRIIGEVWPVRGDSWAFASTAQGRSTTGVTYSYERAIAELMRVLAESWVETVNSGTTGPAIGGGGGGNDI